MPDNKYAAPAQGNGNTPTDAPASAFTPQQVPQPSLPKGGGAIKSIDEKFKVNAANGTSGASIGLPFSASRNDFAPGLSLSYSSGGGNGIFGLGWSAGPGSITRRTDKQLPQYKDGEDSDTFLLSGAEDLVPVLIKDDQGSWTKDNTSAGGLTITRYRPRIESGFVRIEKFTEAAGNVYWKTTSGGNTVTIFGKSTSARIADPAAPEHIFEWLPEFSYDDKGNCYQYEYKQEDKKNIPNELQEKNRLNGNALFTNSYLKRIKYCNKTHFHSTAIDLNNWETFLSGQEYLMEMIFDYGEHDAVIPTPAEVNDWRYRNDAFSNYRAGFEIRTSRLCSRVLMYHMFAELGAQPCLVRSLDIVYTPGPAFTFLTSVTQTGYIRKADGSYSQKSLPPVEYTYQQADWDTTIRTLPKASAENLPTGIDETYQWLDLYNEGIPGIITEQAGSLYYKSNSGDGNFDGLQLIASKPTLTGLNTGSLQFQDIEARGQQFLVNRDLKGYYELTDDQEWLPFRNFSQVPNIDLRNPNLKFLDLNGDGRSDMLIDEDQVFTWFASRGREGFDTYQRSGKSFDEEKGPVTIYDTATQSIVLADMSGDGLTDIVRIRNGEVVYWPNLGYGRFGAKVTMNNAPVFDTPENFNPRYLKLADVDGSGNTSIVYFGHSTFKVYFNRSGNSWSEQGPEGSVNPIPFLNLDDKAIVSVIDLLGNGTGTIVWSSPLPQYQDYPLQYIDLMGGKKPYIMISAKNNMGAETHIEYKPSTYYYLQAKKAGTPWVTRLPFPVQCVSQVISLDQVAKTRFTSQYSYHHGYYDHAEREFRGFGRVDQTDTEDFDNFKKQADPSGKIQIVDERFHQPPVLTRSWFHTGAFLDNEKVLDQFANEYYKNNIIPEKQLTDPPLPGGLTTDEWREALRACKGIPLRSEVYALDGTDKQNIPYTATNTSCLIQQVQPRQQNLYSVWQVQQSEGLVYAYERNPADPRIAHSIVLETDIYGNILKSAAISYGRTTADPDLLPAEQNEQSKTHVVISETSFTNAIVTPDSYRLPSSYENSTWELTGTAPAAGDYYSITEIKNFFNTAAAIAYEVQPTTGKVEKRMLSQSKTLFLKNDLSGPLAEGVTESLGIAYQSYKLALTPGLRDDIFGGKITDDLLLNEGKYLHFNDGNYWIGSGTRTLDPANFYQATVFTDPFGFSSTVVYDSNYRLFVQQTTDAIGNTSGVQGFNYRTLSPYLVQDINDNRSGIRTDELGVVTSNFIMGKATEQKGDLMDTASAEASAKDKPGTTFEYDLFNYQKTGKPNFTKATILDTHFYDLKDGQVPVAYTSYNYASGGGAVIMQKKQAEPGIALLENADGMVTEVDTTPDIRWIGNGRTILNNKGNPVKQYDPYFSTTFEFEDSKELVERGITTITTYDSAGRAVRTSLPNGTFSKVELDAWKQLAYDPNDTVLDSQWYADRIEVPVAGVATPEEIEAANKAAAHANTPGVSYLDTLGRPFLVVSDNGADGKYKVTTQLNIGGQLLSITDARGTVITRSKYGLFGVPLYTKSSEAGERWTLMDVMGKGLRGFDSMGNEFRYSYDKLHRPLGIFVKPGISPEVKLESISYGEGLPNDKANNQRGSSYQYFNGGGVSTNIMFDFKGNLLQSASQLSAVYKNIIDWNSNPDLDPQVFSSSSTFDAMNRTLTTVSPDKSIYIPAYNQAGVINCVDVMLRGSASKTNFIRNINYDVKGRQESIIYGNNTKTTHQFDSLTERLVQMITTGNNGSDLLQKLSYTYDPVGNITNIKDEAQQTVYFKNSVVSPSGTYTYDALYRLISATGREHIGQNLPTAPNDPSRVNLAQPGDGTALRNYIQSYQYDAAGNILKMIHSAGAGSWTRTYSYDASSNRLNSETVGASTQAYSYDVHGNIKNIAQLQGLTWNVKDELLMADLGGGGKAYYVYASGQRSKKVIERPGGSKEIRYYIGGFELYRQFDSTGKILEETETLHITGAGMVETKTIKAGNAAAEQLIRYQYGNHLGSASLELDDKGTIISYEEYHPYGSTAYQAVNASINAAAKRYRYTAMEHDDETGMQYHSARYYLPWLGRWLSADPVGVKGGSNLYAYVGNDPVNNIDTSGHGLKEFAGKVGQVILFYVSMQNPDGDNPGGLNTPAESPFTESTEVAEKKDIGKKDWELFQEELKNRRSGEPGFDPPDKRLVTAQDLHDLRNVGNAKQVPKIKPETPEKKLVTAQDLHDFNNIGNAQRELLQSAAPADNRLLDVKDLADIRRNSSTGALPKVEPVTSSGAAESAIVSGVEVAGTEAASAGSKALKVASVAEGVADFLAPNPLDAVMLTVQTLASSAEGKAILNARGEAWGFVVGLAASLLSTSQGTIKNHLFARIASPSVATIAFDEQGVEERAYDKGLGEGLRFGVKLSANQKTGLLSAVSVLTDVDPSQLDPNSVNDIFQLAAALFPVQENAFERRDILKQQRVHEKWLNSVK